MKKLTLTALALFSVLGTAQANEHGEAAPGAIVGDAGAGKAKAAACAACHGPDGNAPAGNGNPAMPFPKLAGQGAGYIAKQLAEFKAGTRTDATMNGMAAPLSEQDMADIGAYFASQPASTGSADAEKGAKGMKIFTGGISDKGVAACMACHGPNGAGNPGAKYPSLAGQHNLYTIKQLKAFRAGERSNDPAKMMQQVAERLSDEDIAAVAEYIMGLH